MRWRFRIRPMHIALLVATVMYIIAGTASGRPLPAALSARLLTHPSCRSPAAPSLPLPNALPLPAATILPRPATLPWAALAAGESGWVAPAGVGPATMMVTPALWDDTRRSRDATALDPAPTIHLPLLQGGF